MGRMNRIRGWLTLFFLPLFVSFLLGLAAFGIYGGVGFSLLVFLGILMLALSAEERLIRFYSARLSGNRPYLRRRDQAIERELRRLQPNPPRLFIIDSPESLLYVTRNAWGRGSIFMSEGWISTRSEADLVAWLSFAVSETKRKELVLQTLACHLADRIRKLTPRSWIEFVMHSRSVSRDRPLSVGSLEVLWGTICLLLIRYFLGVCGPGNRAFPGILGMNQSLIQKQSFCFNPLRLDPDEHRHQLYRHSLMMRERWV